MDENRTKEETKSCIVKDVNQGENKYIECIVKMLEKLDNKEQRKVFNYVHYIFIKCARD